MHPIRPAGDDSRIMKENSALSTNESATSFLNDNQVSRNAALWQLKGKGKGKIGKPVSVIA